MAQIETVRGPIDADSLGSTLMHERVFVLSPDIMNNFDHKYWDEEECFRDAVDKLQG